MRTLNLTLALALLSAASISADIKISLKQENTNLKVLVDDLLEIWKIDSQTSRDEEES